VAPWIFIRDTDKVEGGLIVQSFGLVFFVVGTLPPEKFSADALAFAICNVLFIFDNARNAILKSCSLYTRWE